MFQIVTLSVLKLFLVKKPNFTKTVHFIFLDSFAYKLRKGVTNVSYLGNNEISIIQFALLILFLNVLFLSGMNYSE
jgi:hypothetical protein